MIYNAKNGYGLKFMNFDEQYNDCIIYRNSKEEIIRLADIIIRSFDKGSLMEELNEMQTYARVLDENGEYKTASLFENKFKIPSYFINLILEKYNMKVLGW